METDSWIPLQDKKWAKVRRREREPEKERDRETTSTVQRARTRKTKGVGPPSLSLDSVETSHHMHEATQAT